MSTGIGLHQRGLGRRPWRTRLLLVAGISVLASPPVFAQPSAGTEASEGAATTAGRAEMAKPANAPTTGAPATATTTTTATATTPATTASAEAPAPPLPPGHPPAGQHRFMAPQPPSNVSQPDSSVPVGTIDAEILDEQGAPVGGVPVELIVNFESVAEGPQRKTVQATTDARGRVRFESLSRELRYSYSLAVEKTGGSYGIGPFRLDEERGQRVRIHVFPTTHDPATAFVGLRGFVYIQPREDLFQVEVLFRVMTMSNLSWLPQNVVMRLPEGFQAFDGPREGTFRFVEEPGQGARLTGTFPPGQHDVRFNFQLPTQRKSSQQLELSLPPHVAELRVIAEAAPGMTLDVDGFEPSEPARGPGGNRVLITRRLMRPGQGELQSVHIEVGGLPTQGGLRWLITALAALIALGGVATAVRRRDDAQSGPTALMGDDLEQARKLLLDELVAVEKAFTAGRLGPRTHEQTRRLLLDALARLEGSGAQAPST